MTILDAPISTQLKLSVNRAEILAILGSACETVNQRTPKPILACVKLIATDDRLTILASDLEVCVRHTTALCQIESQGEICIPASEAKESVDNCTDETITLFVNGEQAVIADKDGETKVYTQNPADFPMIAENESEATIEINAGELLRMIKRTSFALQSDAPQNAFNGTLFEFTGGLFSLVTTDGRRIAVATSKGNVNVISGIVPQKTTKLLEGMIDDEEESISIALTENRITFWTDDWMIASNLLEGQFPDYKSAIPASMSNKLITSSTAFVSAVNRAAQMASETSKAIRINITPLAGATLSAATPGRGDAFVRLPCKYQGDEMSLGINHEFLIQGIKACGADEIVMEVDQPNRPVKFTIADPNWFYVVMPINLETK